MNVDIDVKDFNCSKLEKGKKLHYELTKKYFRKSATFKEGYYTTKNTEELKQQIRKRDMLDIYSSSLDEILQNNSESKSVIDVGCGMGNFTLELVNRKQFKKIVGIYFLKETLRLACENTKLFERATLIEGDLLNIPFNDRSFDITICLNVLHHIHVKDFSNAIQELARITNKYLILEIRNKRNIFNFWHNHITLPIFYKDLPIYTTSTSNANDLMINHNFQLQTVGRKALLSQICGRLVLTYKRTDLEDAY